MPKCKMTVTVTDPDTMLPVTYVAGDNVPKAHAELITNPRVWSGSETPNPGRTHVTAAEQDGARAQAEDDDSEEEEDLGGGSGPDDYESMRVQQLVSLARERQVEIGNNAKKDEIIAALREDDANSD